MPEVTYVHPDGSRTTCVVADGESVLDGALDNAVAGILGQCGGGCTCATCHVYVVAANAVDPPPATGDELEILEYVWQPRRNSRLACQIRMGGGLSTLVVEIPAQQA
jgi:ferredoxin, 2Fe-2S